MKYLLDTCVISDFVKGIGNTEEKIKSLSPSEVAISAITVMELEYGLLLAPEKVKKFSHVVREIISNIQILPFDEEIAEETAEIRVDLKKQGTPIGAYDLLIGATAKKYDLILVTSNIKEFERIGGISIEDWR